MAASRGSKRVGLSRAWLALGLFVLGCAPRADLSLRFRAMVGQRAFARNERFQGLGRGASELSFSDLRLFVSRPRVIDERGREHALSLSRGAQTTPELALLDFAKEATRTLRAEVALPPSARVAGVAFDVGVPFAQNHQDVSTARAPLDASSMFWVWRHGYKFLRLEAESEGPSGKQPVSVHLGSTGCVGASPVATPARCTHPNRVSVRLEDFQPARDVIELDLAVLLANLDLPARDAAAGCESDPEDRDCAGVFRALGLRGEPQRVFRRVREAL